MLSLFTVIRLKMIRPTRSLGASALCLGYLLIFCLSATISVPRLLAQAEIADETGLIHVVEPGETLSEIAKAYGISLDELMVENGITDADAIYEGQELLLPESAQPQPTPLPLPIHVVQSGETLSEIAQQYTVSLTRLMLVNGIRDANAVYEGQELNIPRPADEEKVAAEQAIETLVAVADESTADESTADESTADEATPTAVATLTPAATATAPATATPTIAAAENSAEPTATAGEEAEATETPAAEDENEASEPVDAAARIASLNRSYQVQSGDTFARIALRQGVDAEALRRLNRLRSEDLTDLRIGQILLLPANGTDFQVRKPAKSYVIQGGDSLGSIANQFDLTTADLLTANGIADPDLIAVGQELTIPEKSKTADATAGTNVGPQRSGFYYYTVQPGETISELAQAFNTSRLAILEYNGLPDEQTIYAGLEIRIPYGPPILPQRRPPVPASGTSFLVSLSRQKCWLFAGDRVAQAWNCSTGYGEWITRVGSFAVQSKIEMAESSAYQLDMPYWLGIYNVGKYENGIHGLPIEWSTGERIWESLVGEPATFGCAMLDDRDAVVLFETAYIGMPIHIIN